MDKPKDGNSIFIEQGRYKYEVVAGVALVSRSEPKEPHSGEWEARITIFRIGADEPDKAQYVRDVSLYGATEHEARRKAHDYGRKLVTGAIKGLNI